MMQRRIDRYCEENSDRINTRLRKRVQLKFSNGQLLPAYSILPRFTFDKINSNNFDNLSVFNLSLDNKFWNSKTDFLENGFGFILNNEIGLPVSVCYSACVENGVAEIDVATLPDFRIKGLRNWSLAGLWIIVLIMELLRIGIVLKTMWDL